MSFVKQLAGETAIYGISNILSRIVYFIFLTAYLTRVFSDRSLYGIHQDLYSYMALLLILFTYRMETAYFRMGSEKKDENKAFSTAFISICSTTVLLGSLMLVFRESLASLLEYVNQGIYIIYMILIIAFDAIAAIPFARLRLQKRPYRFAFIKVINVVATILLVIFFLEVCPFLIDRGFTFFEQIYRPENKLDLVIIANVISSGFVLILLIPQIFQERLIFDSLLLRKMLWYLLPLIIVSVAGVFNQSFSVPFLKYLLPGSNTSNLEDAAIFAAAAKIAILMNLFTQAFNYAAEPFFFSKSRDTDVKETYADVAQAFSLAACISMLVIALYVDIFKVILAPSYRSGLYIVPVLLLAYWFLGLYYNFSIWYKIEDKTYMGAIISCVGVFITLTIAILLIPDYGMIAMAWASLACYGFMAIASYATGQRYYPVQYPIGRILLYLLLTITTYCIYYFLTQSIPMNMVISFIVSTILLGSFIAIIYAIEKKKILSWAGFPQK